MEEGSDLSVVNKEGNTSLHLAASNGHTDIVKLLVEKGSDLSAVNKDGAAVYDCTEIVESLLEEGKNPLSKDIDGKTPRELATDENLVQIFRVAEIKQQEYDATKWGTVSGGSTAALGATVAATLFATVFTIGFLPIVGAVAAITTSALAIGGATYMVLKPNTE
ncbi:phosphocholine transferase AnkX [Trichonephila clavata]|uniref:Phosphocholine transferase AnkX n=1 Tax=Trichonephila clavata TaxID=2740835 RepID=A0A8X6L633_TRICU|nr:phosphocholine transferase AnkX [Trichonephila clavata]